LSRSSGRPVGVVMALRAWKSGFESWMCLDVSFFLRRFFIANNLSCLVGGNITSVAISATAGGNITSVTLSDTCISMVIFSSLKIRCWLIFKNFRGKIFTVSHAHKIMRLRYLRHKHTEFELTGKLKRLPWKTKKIEIKIFKARQKFAKSLKLLDFTVFKFYYRAQHRSIYAPGAYRCSIASIAYNRNIDKRLTCKLVWLLETSLA